MRKIIGIVLLVILNLIFIGSNIGNAIVKYGIINGEHGKDLGLEISRGVDLNIFEYLLISAVVICLLNYIIIKNIIKTNNLIKTNFLIIAIGIAIFLIFFLKARKSFLDHQFNSTALRHYLDLRKIAKIQIVSYLDTIEISEQDKFLREIGNVKYLEGKLSYSETMTLLFYDSAGRFESINTNGQIFGSYKEKYFYSDRNILAKYKE